MTRHTHRHLPPILGLVLLLALTGAHSATRVLYLPFKDNVRMKDAWDLGVDVPRYFSTTVDTIGLKDTSVTIVPFDSVMAFIKANSLKRDEYMTKQWLVRIASRFGADLVLSGTVTQFSVLKQTISTDAPLDASTDIGKNTTGTGGVRVMGGLQSYTAKVTLSIDIYDGSRGVIVDNLPLSTSQKDAGFKIYLAMMPENDEMNFYYMSRSPFGSSYFQKSVAGAIMKGFSLDTKRRLQVVDTRKSTADATAPTKASVSGKVLDRAGADVYVDLGQADQVVPGDVLEVMKRDHPVLGPAGDTLGWAEKPVGTLSVRFVKAAHFSQATVVEESDTIAAGHSVRQKLGGAPVKQ
jgi:hypothetical protein